MKILTCPMNGPRNINEFQNVGPLKVNPDPDATSDQDWVRHLFRADNSRGMVAACAVELFLSGRAQRHDKRGDPHL